MNERIYSYGAVVPANARVLILGTIASAESLRQGFYYAHPRNCFWPMLADIFQEDAPGTIEEKKALLHRHRIALWDMAHSCVRSGSLDSAMREIELNDIASVLRRYPGIKKVLLNGGTAHRLYGKIENTVPPVEALRMPSTSPAYTLPYAQKKAQWEKALRQENTQSEEL